MAKCKSEVELIGSGHDLGSIPQLWGASSGIVWPPKRYGSSQVGIAIGFPCICTLSTTTDSMFRLFFLTFLLTSALGCGGSGESSSEPEEGGFHLLDAMLQIEISYKAIEPNFRNPQAFEENAVAAKEILAWADDSTFEEFVEGSRFYSEPQAFLAVRDAMRAGAQTVLDGANAEDVDQIREGFIKLKQSCIGCHKRYSPSY